MALLLLAGLMLLTAWVIWILYIVDRHPVTVSLLVKVEQAEDYLDPFLRLLRQLFQQSNRVLLGEIWVLTADDGEEARRIVQRLNFDTPLFRFRSSVGEFGNGLVDANGQVLLILDLVNRLTPAAAVQAVSQLLTAGPTPPGTTVLDTGR
jgi:hypothetical protein